MEEPKITPLARRLAEENGIDWRKLQGSGPDGTIVERDVLAFLAKVMAGEVDLPPAPEPPPPPSPNPSDLERAMNLLAKEGVQPEEVLPGVPKSTEPSSETLDDLEGLLDLDLELEEELPKEVEPALLTWPEHTFPQEETESLPLWEEEMLSSSTPQTQEEAALWSSPLEEDEALVDLEVAKEPLPPAMGTAPEALGIAPGLSPAPAALRPIQVHRLRLELAPAQRAREILSKAWGKEVGLSALLVHAAAKALDELHLPYAALLGRREGETIKGHLLPPGGLRALVSGEKGPEGEGLFCLTGGEEIHTGAPLLYLHEEGLLTLSGPFEPSSAQALLERVKAYLEEPLLLFT